METPGLADKASSERCQNSRSYRSFLPVEYHTYCSQSGSGSGIGNFLFFPYRNRKRIMFEILLSATVPKASIKYQISNIKYHVSRITYLIKQKRGMPRSVAFSV